MDLEKVISEELVKATKANEKLRKETLRSIRAAIIEFKKSGEGREIDDETAMRILKSAAKRRRDSIEQFEKAGRDDLVENEKKELAVIMEFLPEQMSEEEIEKIVDAKIQAVGAESPSDMGKVMGAVMKEIGGKADGSAVKRIVQEKLSS